MSTLLPFHPDKDKRERAELGTNDVLLKQENKTLQIEGGSLNETFASGNNLNVWS